jgi:hypothetical protein
MGKRRTLSSGPVSKNVLNIRSAIGVGDKADIYKKFEIVCLRRTAVGCAATLSR